MSDSPLYPGKLPKPPLDPRPVLAIAAAGVAAFALTAALMPRRTRAPKARVTSLPPRPPRRSAALAALTAKPLTWVDPDSVGKPYSTKVKGLLTFRGNPTRSYYGEGPVPVQPQVLWRYPKKPMCALSADKGVTYEWCGTGWTGQPAVFEKGDKTWVVFGAYDKALHFLDAATGEDLRRPFKTQDIIKGSVTIDPDGFPIVYSGSRDSYFRAVAFDTDPPRELWKLWAHDVKPTLWNDDWDGSGLVLDDYLFEGGENSQIHIAKLNRHYDAKGLVQVSPELVFHAPGWDQELLSDLGDHEVSIENSVAIHGNHLFFANSGGLAQAWDIAGLKKGLAPVRDFRFWTGDDTDASVVVDKDGDFYVASEWERHNPRSRRTGQLMKLDPKAKEPLQWSLDDQQGVKSGIWATPALYKNQLIVATHAGEVMAIDKVAATLDWTLRLEGKTWQSPVVVDDVLVQGDCSGTLHGYDLKDPKAPPAPLWQVRLGGCIESTPAVWKGRIFVGARDGYFYALGDAP